MAGAPGDVSRRVSAAWAALAGVDELTALQVLVQRESRLCPHGWIGVVRIEDSVTAVVPTDALATAMTEVLSSVSAWDATSPEVLARRLPSIANVLGPAGLYYPDPLAGSASGDGLEVIAPTDLGDMLTINDPSEVEESGLREITSEASVIRDERGNVVAACGYRHWPASIAHLGVLTSPGHRGHGLARAVASDAVARAAAEGLLPQWRARPAASRAVAAAIGLREVGAQLSIQLSPTHDGACCGKA